MAPGFLWAAVVWFGFWNLFGAALAAHDKIAAKKHRRRVPEKKLLLAGALGGATGMYAAMLLIRHKTKHLKFMLGLPALTLLHALALWLLTSFLTR